LIYYKDNYYLRVYGVENCSEKYYIYSNGKSIEKSKLGILSEFLPTERENQDRKVIVNNLKLNTIIKLQFEDIMFRRLIKRG
jgi:hypothetical protein